ncbi:hypothetical protein FRUB_07422 [Fimbriiglobus ruber]|uniref:Uncharacterized protein n=2 Tax=Fimbriiglobus ruber TaxID=1908690 RepID=A0A225DA10_9BACT|nr:hypothetical protein FRUB_07422 [Fimbriiglobus ruber]
MAAVVSCLIATTAAQVGPFEITVKPLVAIEGGPVVLEATLIYHGAAPLEINNFSPRGPFSLELPPDWQVVRWTSVRTEPDFFLFVGPSKAVLHPGDRTTRIISLNRSYAFAFPAGTYKLTISAYLSAVRFYTTSQFNQLLSSNPPGEPPNQLPKPPKQLAVKTFSLDIKKYDRAVAQDLRDRVNSGLRTLREGTGSYSDRSLEIEWLCGMTIGSQHPEAAESALSLLWSGEADIPGYEICRDVLRWQPVLKTVNRDLVSYVISDRPSHMCGIMSAWKDAEAAAAVSYRQLIGTVFGYYDEPIYRRRSKPAATDRRDGASLPFMTKKVSPDQSTVTWTVTLPEPTVFDHWYDRLQKLNFVWQNTPGRLSDDDLRRLTTAKDVRVKLLTYLIFSNRVEPKWVDQLEREVVAWNAELPANELDKVIGQIDDDDSDTRRRAKQALQRYAEREGVKNGLVRLLREDHQRSPETHRRIREILERPDMWERGVDHYLTVELTTGDTPERRKILKLLSTGAADSPWTKLAAKALSPVSR